MTRKRFRRKIIGLEDALSPDKIVESEEFAERIASRMRAAMPGSSDSYEGERMPEKHHDLNSDYQAALGALRGYLAANDIRI